MSGICSRCGQLVHSWGCFDCHMEKEYEAYLEEKAQADPAIWLDGPNSEAARAARGEGSFVHDVLVRLYLQHIADHLDRLVLETLKP